MKNKHLDGEIWERTEVTNFFWQKIQRAKCSSLSRGYWQLNRVKIYFSWIVMIQGLMFPSIIVTFKKCISARPPFTSSGVLLQINTFILLPFSKAFPQMHHPQSGRCDGCQDSCRNFHATWSPTYGVPVPDSSGFSQTSLASVQFRVLSLDRSGCCFFSPIPHRCDAVPVLLNGHRYGVILRFLP